MTPRQALIEARKLIESDEFSFICIALQNIASRHVAGMIAKKEIERLINRAIPLEIWLETQGVVLPPYSDKNRRSYMKEYRLLWIDHLLATNPVFVE